MIDDKIDRDIYIHIEIYTYIHNYLRHDLIAIAINHLSIYISQT